MDTFNIFTETNKITLLEAANVVQDRKPFGLFYCSTAEPNDWIAVDNSGGNAFVHECNNEKECKEWLLSDQAREEEKYDKAE